MKITTNFSFPVERWVPWLSGLGWTVSVLALLITVALAFNAVFIGRQKPALEKEWKDLQVKPMPVAAPQAVSAQQAVSLKKRLKSLSALEAGGGRSVGSLLSKLEGLLPEGSRLTHFQHEQKSGEIQVTVGSANSDDLSRFLLALETDTVFTSALLTRQSKQPDGMILFDVRFKEARP